MKSKRLFFILCLLGPIVLKAQMPKSSSLTTDQRAAALVSRMTLEEKVGQMTQVSIDILLKKNANTTAEPHVLDPDKLATAVKKYKVGSILNVGGNAQTRENWQQTISTIQ